MTPIFTPYPNIPTLNDYDLDVTYIQANTIDADGLHTWQYPDSELEKLRDPSIKLLCLVNPSNPPSVALDDASRAKLVSLVKNERPDLIIISDDVYGTFVPHYRSLLDDLPYNTACVYSFSKYFGATGWRLAVIATAQNNVFDDLIAKLPDDKKKALANRYACLTDHIEKVKFTDRMVADSRLVALNGTAGLGTPQQVMMSLFALYCLLDDHDAYRTKMQQLVQHRLGLLWKSLGWTLEPDPERAGYYSVIDLSIWATRLYGADFFAWLKEELRLAGHRGATRPGHRRRAHGRPRLRRPGMVGARIAGEPERRRLHRHRPAPLGHARPTTPRYGRRRSSRYFSSATMSVPVSPRRPAAAWSSEVMTARPPGCASTNFTQACTFGSMEPGANCPCSM